MVIGMSATIGLGYPTNPGNVPPPTTRCHLALRGALFPKLDSVKTSRCALLRVPAKVRSGHTVASLTGLRIIV